MNAVEIIEAFGGSASVAGLTGARRNAVSQWRRIGIPARYWHLLIAAAETRGIAGITPEALGATKPCAKAAA